MNDSSRAEQAGDSASPLPSQPSTYLKPAHPKRNRWLIPVIIIVGVAFMFFIGIAVFFAAIGHSIEEGFSVKKEVIVKKNSVLVLNFAQPLQEYSPSNVILAGKSGAPSFLETLQAIKRAKNDDNIRGIYITASNVNTGFARASEIHEALEDFKQSGKFIYAYIESGGKPDYFLALPADSIFMPQQGFITLNAAGASVLFYKGLLEKLGVDVYVEQFEEYKSFGEQYSRANFSAPAKEELRALIEQRNNAYNNAVAKYRRLSVEKVVKAINHGLFRSDSLLAAGFIDAIAGDQDAHDRIEKRIASADAAKSPDKSDKQKKKKKYANYISLSDYSASRNDNSDDINAGKDNQIAIIYGVGGIRTGKNSNGFSGDAEIASGTFISYLKKAREDDKVKVIILRIDSPGGSALASDLIWEEIRKTRAVKPVYASMSEVAASGGYYIPMACDTIIASPHTITGSIGVIAVIPSFKGTLDKVGLSVDTISTGESSQLMNPMLGYSSEHRIRFREQMEPIYTQFVSKAAASRKKTYDEMRALAKGRVWSGNDAKKAGLVDVLGGFQTAISLAKRRIGVADSVKVIVQEYPRRLSGIAALLKMFNISDDTDDDDAVANNGVDLTASDKAWQVLAMSGVLPDILVDHAKHALLLARMSKGERALAALPYTFDIR